MQRIYRQWQRNWMQWKITKRNPKSANKQEKQQRRKYKKKKKWNELKMRSEKGCMASDNHKNEWRKRKPNKMNRWRLLLYFIVLKLPWFGILRVSVLSSHIHNAFRSICFHRISFSFSSLWIFVSEWVSVSARVCVCVVASNNQCKCVSIGSLMLFKSST